MLDEGVVKLENAKDSFQDFGKLGYNQNINLILSKIMYPKYVFNGRKSLF